ncbi:hypothetical protein AX774_g8199 [Zancudomyces culisetae]|uniref:Uncharacterized protein n=1 Tax=Zancudomyces culisetae TaxID=1213189 RepID=A0A1R1PBU3_ZANCU|nr:hypothetical protein AX774_g8199 [Zancudomyces culisetae]|eukprot:OMH78411.1 hypothetical protein AX774_g8199 [Zancudomyces culisetae]
MKLIVPTLSAFTLIFQRATVVLGFEDEILQLVKASGRTDYILYDSDTLATRGIEYASMYQNDPNVIGFTRIPFSEYFIDDAESNDGTVPRTNKKLLIKEVCQVNYMESVKSILWDYTTKKVDNSQQGYQCTYPIYDARIWHNDFAYVVDKNRSFLQIELCVRNFEVDIKFMVLRIAEGKSLQKPINANCAYSLYATVYKVE